MGKAEKWDEEQLDAFQDKKKKKTQTENTWKNVEGGQRTG